MELLLAPESWPFTFAVMLVLLVGLVESLSLALGASLSGVLDNVLPQDIDGLADSWLGWLHVGKVPVLVLLILLLTAFSLFGLGLNALVFGLTGSYPPIILSSAFALFGALPVAHGLGGVIGRLIPKDETSAVSLDSLVGHVAVVVNGTARKAYPAQAKVRTEQGQTFYVHVEPTDDGTQFVVGDSVLLIQQVSGARFLGIANPRPDIL